MLTVIFGAGASYDSNPSRPPVKSAVDRFRPPLANDLFADRDFFASTVALIERIQPVVPRLRHTAGKNVESVLRELQDEAAQYPERHRQLMAVRYYLQCMLSKCEQSWKVEARGVSNYRSLLDEIAHWRQGTGAVCLVTFNYDTLLEDAMSSVGGTIKELNDYVFGNPAYRCFKLHGSVDWARIVETTLPSYPDHNNWAVARNHIDRAATLKITNDFVRITEYPCGMWQDRFALVPAIAIPVEQKSYFECPADHLHELARLLPETDRLLLIGWRATEDHFLKLLTKHVTRPLACTIVAGAEAEARDIASRVGPALAGVRVDWKFAPGGFTDFIVNRRFDRL